VYKILKNDKSYNVSCIELFAGAGGLALGLKNAGLHCNLLVEIDKHAAATLKHNLPDCTIINDDVRDVGYDGMTVDVVSGGFPWQSFSYAGRKLGFDDVRGTLFFELLRCAKEVQPKIVLGENVKGLLRHDGGKTLATMVSLLEQLGYKVQYKVVKSQYLDVPQKREHPNHLWCS
jgi:DNA (cytosine-5)-methyltransferase 1